VPLGPFVVDALPIPHDAPQVAFRVSAGGRRFGIATDLGHVTRELRAFLAGCDVVFLESNYCPLLLETGPYPLRLKRRVAGPIGHLANEQTAELARSLEDTRVARLVLVHLSRTNNSPERALEVVSSRAHRLRVEALAARRAAPLRRRRRRGRERFAAPNSWRSASDAWPADGRPRPVVLDRRHHDGPHRPLPPPQEGPPRPRPSALQERPRQAHLRGGLQGGLADVDQDSVKFINTIA
jgi:hypothetical protein